MTEHTVAGAASDLAKPYRIPCYADRSATKRGEQSIAVEDADVTDLIDYRAVITSAAIAQRRRERSANDWVSSM